MILKSIKSFRYAIRGIDNVIRNENNAKVHLFATFVIVATGFYLKISVKDWCILVFAIALVWVSEIINTAIEKTVNLISEDFNQKAGLIKDISAGAVLIASITAVVIGVLIFLNQ